MHPRDIAAAARTLRAASCELFDRLDAEQRATEVLPGWSAADVFRHLAEADRAVVLLTGLRHYLPKVTIRGMERRNDDGLERLRALPDEQLRRELEDWGRRLAAIIGATPGFVTRVKLPTVYGRVGLDWFAALRVYDEWVHQWDVHQALDLAPEHGDPGADETTRAVIAEFLYRELPARGLRDGLSVDGVVQVKLTGSGGVPAWRFDLTARRSGPDVINDPTVSITCDTLTWLLIRSERLDWRDVERDGDLLVEGPARAAAEALLAVVPVQ